ncbi:MAG UNVERIFIED_CONTAM: hypothetical protein LVT10_23515 [Anaerolineae bacterium]
MDASVLPVIDMLSIEQTATALSGFIVPTATRPPATQALTLSPVATMNGTAQARGASVQKGSTCSPTAITLPWAPPHHLSGGFHDRHCLAVVCHYRATSARPFSRVPLQRGTG